jgi:hypothetical protein
MCSVQCKRCNTMVSTTHLSDYCIGFLLGYPCYPVMNGLLALCTYFVVCSDRVEFCTYLVLIHDEPFPLWSPGGFPILVLLSYRFFCFACPFQSNENVSCPADVLLVRHVVSWVVRPSRWRFPSWHLDQPVQEVSDSLSVHASQSIHDPRNQVRLGDAVAVSRGDRISDKRLWYDWYW